MKRFILTGAPGAGKTTILHALKAVGHKVVAEAATDLIEREHARGVIDPWTIGDFIDHIVTLQRRRQTRALAAAAPVQFFDRSPVCTHALSVFLGLPFSAKLEAELARIEAQGIYQRQVFFMENLGFVTPTAVRRITFADTLAFERVHEESYRAFGYELVRVPAAPVAERAQAILGLVGLGAA
jgi:predicted ATPase